MAQLTFGVSGQTLDITAGFEISDTDAPRILAYLASTEYGKVKEVDGEGIESTRDATPEETATAFARGILRGLLDQTVRYEKDKAAQEAASSVTNIDSTPV